MFEGMEVVIFKLIHIILILLIKIDHPDVVPNTSSFGSIIEKEQALISIRT